MKSVTAILECQRKFSAIAEPKFIRDPPVSMPANCCVFTSHNGADWTPSNNMGSRINIMAFKIRKKRKEAGNCLITMLQEGCESFFDQQSGVEYDYFVTDGKEVVAGVSFQCVCYN